jgi:acyl-CoA hydrolase
MSSNSAHLKDLELIQLVSLGDAISVKALNSNAYRLKTFFSGWVAGEAITAGRVDLIPSSFSRIPRYIESGRIPIDVAFIQITPPNEAGYCSLGVAVDVSRQAMEQASMVVGEINFEIPTTTTTMRMTMIAPRPINIHFFIILSPFEFREEIPGSDLLNGKLGTKKASVNMRREEKQIVDREGNVKGVND